MQSYINNMLDITFSDGQQHVGHLLKFFWRPLLRPSFVFIPLQSRVLIERETLLTTFLIGQQLPVVNMVYYDLLLFFTSGDQISILGLFSVGWRWYCSSMCMPCHTISSAYIIQPRSQGGLVEFQGSMGIFHHLVLIIMLQDIISSPVHSLQTHTGA